MDFKWQLFVFIYIFLLKLIKQHYVNVFINIALCWSEGSKTDC